MFGRRKRGRRIRLEPLPEVTKSEQSTPSTAAAEDPWVDEDFVEETDPVGTEPEFVGDEPEDAPFLPELEPVDDPTVLEADSAGEGDAHAAAGSGGGGRRRLRRRQGGDGDSPLGSTRPVLVAAAIAVVAVLLATLVQRPVPTAAEGATSIEPIGSALLLCPEPGAGTDLGVRVTAAVVPGQPGQDVPGDAGLRTLPGKLSAQSRIEVPGGQAQIEAFGRALPPIMAYGNDGLAPGLVADQWGRDPAGRGRGMASTACAPAGSEFWFVGGGAIAGRVTRIVLVNPDPTAAVVDVIVRGENGIIDAPAGMGLVVKGEDRLVVRLDVLAPGVAATAVQVIARTGRVGAAVDDEQRSGLANVGTDWVPRAAPPATKVYVPGIVNGAGARVLSVAAPGGDDAIVNVRIITADGTYAPAERARIEVPADTVVALDMAPVLNKEPATLELTSDVPIVAGMRMFFGNETSFSAGSQPYLEPAAVSGLPVRSSTDVRVGITAPDTDAEVQLTVLPYGGGKEAAQATSPRTIKVPAGTMSWIRIQPPSGVDWYTAVVTPVEGSGPVLVAHRLREKSRFGDLVTGYPWNPLRTEVVVPTAAQDPGVALR
ncbi:MAG: hypothetical protein GC156_08580 [Actinomycetales bacterium]|nr:hypothetical protein [Actinomycetales bacterium]